MTMEPNSSATRLRVAAIIIQENRILLIRQTKGDATYWLLPGGGVEPGETLAEALMREVYEETGLYIRVLDLFLLSDGIAPDKSRHIVNLFFTAEHTGGVLTLGNESNLTELRYVDQDELETIELRPDIRPFLLDFMRDGHYPDTKYTGNIWK